MSCGVLSGKNKGTVDECIKKKQVRRFGEIAVGTEKLNTLNDEALEIRKVKLLKRFDMNSKRLLNANGKDLTNIRTEMRRDRFNLREIERLTKKANNKTKIVRENKNVNDKSDVASNIISLRKMIDNFEGKGGNVSQELKTRLKKIENRIIRVKAGNSVGDLKNQVEDAKEDLKDEKK